MEIAGLCLPLKPQKEKIRIFLMFANSKEDHKLSGLPYLEMQRRTHPGWTASQG